MSTSHTSDALFQAHLDLRSHILFVDDYSDLGPETITPAEWRTRFLHERNHWTRFQGSTTGLLMHLLKFARDETAMRALESTDIRAKARIDQRRKRDIPVWSYAEGPSSEVAGTAFGLLGESWLDLDFTSRLFFDFEEVTRANALVPVEEAVRSSLGAAWFFAGQLPDFVAFPGKVEASSVFFGDIAACSNTSMGPMTSRLLWESASMVDEFRFAAGALGWPRNEPMLERIRTELRRSPNAAP